jgi:hypothetical protein
MSDSEVAQRLVGAWRLVSWTETLADGTVRPSAAGDQGDLVYSVDHMCAVIQNSKRQGWSGPPSDLADASSRLAGVIGYCGKVDIHASEGFLVHTVDMDFNPRNIGIVRKRWFTFEGPDRLSLRVDSSETQRNVVKSVLTWERIRHP